MKRALVPGTFDPITSGHLDIITRSTHLADEIIVAVAPSAKKNPLFPLEKRVQLAREATAHLPNVHVVSLEGLLVEFAHKMGATAVIKGLRAITDFEYEFQQTDSLHAGPLGQFRARLRSEGTSGQIRPAAVRPAPRGVESFSRTFPST